ncbi:hypothetical protein [Salipiger sp. CCB-MM3]|uniref:hypothetical protein n=1 Tax=Salipiger sp. CCB-MM3 TaxID=1792508 RepID=UPI0012F756E0|nr:hypothetical protein [Salipiger sp. CCB-MM3]
MKIDKNLARRRKPASAGSRPPSADKTQLRALPWYQLFCDRGYSDHYIPRDHPPQERNFIKIEEWITRGGWIDEADTDLAMDIWFGQVDPLNYVPPEKSAPSVQHEPSSTEPQDSGDEAGKPLKRRKGRFAKKREARNGNMPASPGP